jgi:hypothetical protein
MTLGPVFFSVLPTVALPLLVFLVAIILGRLVRRDNRRYASIRYRWPLESVRLLPQDERKLFDRITRTLTDVVVLIQVPITAFVRVKEGAISAGLVNRYEKLCVDFLICNRDTSVIAAVVLDNKARDPKDRHRSDAWKKQRHHALVSAGIPVLQWNLVDPPDEAGILAALEAARNKAPESAR